MKQKKPQRVNYIKEKKVNLEKNNCTRKKMYNKNQNHDRKDEAELIEVILRMAIHQE